MISEAINASGKTVSFGTHSGIFHCDEVVGIAILQIAHMNSKVCVCRTRDLNILNECDIVIDIGGGKFDHHMAGFNVCRPTGEKYASAGLVWESYAETTIKNIMAEAGVSIGNDDIASIKEQVDREVIIPVDLEDNGIQISESHMFSFVPMFRPSWLDNPDFDGAFAEAVSVVKSILFHLIKEKVVNAATKMKFNDLFNFIDDGILEIPAQNMPWPENVVKYNESHNNEVKFVIFPYPSGGWAAQCVPPSLDRRMEKLVPFPKEWAGGNESTLPQISGIEDATFCHSGRFFARAKSRDSITQMCRIAMGKHD